MANTTTAPVPTRVPRENEANVVVAACCFVTAALAYYQLTRPGMLTGVTGIDDGAYFGTAVRLVHGVIPYRDFVALHPPGMPLLLTPIALLSNVIGTRDGLAVCRLILPAVAVANVLLVGLLMRRHGRLPTLMACGALAIQPDVLVSVHTIELEPVLVLFCLLGAVTIFRADHLGSRRALLLGGVFFGFAGAVKVWAIFPVAIVGLICLMNARRLLGPFALGVAVGFLGPCLFFIAVAPSAFFHDVVVAQVGRVGGHRVPLAERMTGLMGVRDLGALANYAVEVGGVVLLLIVGVFVFTRGALSAFEWFVLGTTALLVVAFLTPEQFFSHYSAFFAPFLALALGLGTARLSGAIDPKGVLLLLAVALVGLALNDGQYINSGTGVNIKPAYAIPLIDVVVPKGACVLADNVALPILANRFVPDRPGCTTIVDPFGTSVADGTGLPLGDGGPVPRRLVGLWLTAFRHADYVVLDGPAFAGLRIPFLPPITSYLTRAFHLVVHKPGQFSGLLIYVRDGFPSHRPAQ
jgi:alpha-1,2-mannosyltransferase